VNAAWHSRGSGDTLSILAGTGHVRIASTLLAADTH
jgi:hypothetical protein